MLGNPNPGLKGGTVQFYQVLRDTEAASSTCMIGLGFHSSVAQFNSQLVTHVPHPAVHNAATGVHLGREGRKSVTLPEAHQQSCSPQYGRNGGMPKAHLISKLILQQLKDIVMTQKQSFLQGLGDVD